MQADIYLSASADLAHRVYTAGEDEARDARQALLEHFGGGLSGYTIRSFRVEVTQPAEVDSVLRQLNTWAQAPDRMLPSFVATMKDETLELIASGRIPQDVKSFSQLHDHIDANELGGFCDDDVSTALLLWFGGRDADDSWPQVMLDFINQAQGAIDEWLALGRPVSNPQGKP